MTPAPPPVRSAEALVAVVAKLDPERAERYRPRDVTGDGKAETFCNVFLRDALLELGLEVPAALANDMVDWFDGEKGKAAGWRRVTLHQAEVLARDGYPVAVGWKNSRGHGHVALGVPPPLREDGTPAPGLHCAQAGKSNWRCRPVLRGFGAVDFKVWGHD